MLLPVNVGEVLEQTHFRYPEFGFFGRQYYLTTSPYIKIFLHSISIPTQPNDLPTSPMTFSFDINFFLQLHLIHWNCTQYSSLDEALGKPDGIAIVALFIQVCTCKISCMC